MAGWGQSRAMPNGHDVDEPRPLPMTTTQYARALAYAVSHGHYEGAAEFVQSVARVLGFDGVEVVGA